jgi:cardiolipin synthase A/B
MVIKYSNWVFSLLYLMILPACSSVPILVPDMAIQSPKKISLENANGVISPVQSKKIIEKIKKDGFETNIFDKHLALISSVIGSPLMVGNKVDLLVDGQSTYAAMLSAIENAKDHINMETYIFEDDEIGQQFSTILIAKQQSGVQVNLIYDSAGSHGTPKTFFDKLKVTGVHVLEFNPINPLNKRKDWEWNERDHRKLLIVDGKVAFVGGINISSVYSSGSFSGSFSGSSKQASKQSKDGEISVPWRDTHLQLSGPVVAEFQKMFTQTWAQQKGEALPAKEYFPELTNQGNEIVRAIGSNPDEAYSQIYATLLSAINSAETQVYLTNAYFVPDPQLLAALKDAVKRGADVRLLLPEKTDSSLVFYASRSYYDELLSANVKIYEHKVALLHAKTALIDGVWSTVGSTNLDWRSFVNNQEINAVILGQGFGAQMQNLFEKDLASSEQIILEEWRKRSIGARIKEQSARLWARFL